MKILLDTHTHTLASGHAYSTLEENVKHAAHIGLEAIAVTDHAPMMAHTTCHAYFANLHVIPRILHNVRILRGIELNIMDFDGTVDMDDKILSRLDLAIASLHVPCIKPGTKEENTNACLKAMEHPWIDILGHPGDPRYPLDYDALVQRAKETHTLLEVNNTSLIPGGFRDGSAENIEYMLRLCKKAQVGIVVGSDAHFYTSIGDFTLAKALLKKVDFPKHLICNRNTKCLLAARKRSRLMRQE